MAVRMCGKKIALCSVPFQNFRECSMLRGVATRSSFYLIRWFDGHQKRIDIFYFTTQVPQFAMMAGSEPQLK